jgi:hypothetical protein
MFYYPVKEAGKIERWQEVLDAIQNLPHWDEGTKTLLRCFLLEFNHISVNTRIDIVYKAIILKRFPLYPFLCYLEFVMSAIESPNLDQLRKSYMLSLLSNFEKPRSREVLSRVLQEN